MYKLFSILVALMFLPFGAMGGEVNGIELVKAIEKEFVEQGIANEVELEIFGGKTNFDVKDASDIKIMISGLKADVDNNKFTADAEIFADGMAVEKTELSGRFFIMKDVYVPVSDIAKGEIVKAEHMKSVLMRENRIQNDSVIDLDNIIGKQTVKLLKADKLINQRDLREEVIIKKGQEITVIYKNKGLQITSKMQALEDGSKDSFIKFLNAKSAKEVVAKVIDKNTAEIKAE